MTLPEGRVAPDLEICHGCRQFVYAGTRTCPHCGQDEPAAAAVRAAALEAAQAALHEVAAILVAADRFSTDR